MVQRKVRKYDQYTPLYAALRRGKYKSPGTLAGLLLETFLLHNGELRSEQLIEAGVCAKGSFTVVRTKLIKDGYLIWSETQTYKSIYFAGKRLIKYLNREKLATQEVATMEDIIPKKQLQKEFEKTRKKLADVEQRLSKVEDAIEKGIENYLKDNPPDTLERRKAAKKAFLETGTIRVH